MVLDDLLPGVQHLQNVHPLVVHFPLAFLTGAVGLYIAAWVMRRDWWAWLPFWLLMLGTLATGLAVATGLRAEPGVMVARSVRAELLVRFSRAFFTSAMRPTADGYPSGWWPHSQFAVPCPWRRS